MEDDAIRITHYINPHMFWYKPESAYVHNLDEKRFQLKIDEYCEQHFRRASSDSYYDGFPGEVRLLFELIVQNQSKRGVLFQRESILTFAGEKLQGLL